MRKSIQVDIDGVAIGGGAPIVIQSMTDTPTADIQKTVNQVIDLVDAGSQIVRLTVDTDEAAKAIPKIKSRLTLLGYNIPLVGDFHYNGHRLLQDNPDCAQALSKYRINPGNVGFGRKKDTQFSAIIQVAIKYNKAVRIGVNWGSLDQTILQKIIDKNLLRSEPLSNDDIMCEALIKSALDSANYAQELGLPDNKIIISCKVSSVPQLINIYTSLAKECKYALHLGLTEAGMGLKSIVASSISIGSLLLNDIGDTIRVSLTPEPGAHREKEIHVCKEILQALGLRSFKPTVTSCPGCGRTSSDYFRKLAQNIDAFLEKKMIIWRKEYPGVENMQLAVMGCIVNGPGESKHANIGISLPGSGEDPVAPVFVGALF